MQQQTQGHKLRDIWDVEDAAKSASQSAALAKEYHQLTAQNVSAVSVEIDRLNANDNHANDRIKRLERLRADDRAHCLAWGIGGGIVTSLVMALIMAQLNPHQNLATQQSVEPMQNACVELVPQIQTPRTVQAKAKSIKRFTIQKRG